MKKALLVSHVSGFIPQFEMNNVRLLQSMEYEVHYASNFFNPSYGKDNKRLVGTNIIKHQVDFVRSPYKFANITAYRQLKQLMLQERFDMVHCHNPMSGALARLAARATDIRPVVYTAHGFHFFKGAPIRNWLIYYTMEYFLSFYTDQQICINREDYERAKARFHVNKISYIPGVGIDIKKIADVFIDKAVKRRELGIPIDAKVVLSAGELIKRKNHETVIRAMVGIEDKDIIYVICGHGELDSYLKNVVKELNLESQVYFVGYRTDIYEIYKMADVFVFPSIQEGLPMALLEAMAAELPIVCSGIRGNCDLVDEEGGVLVNPTDVSAYRSAIQNICSDEVMRKKMGCCNKLKAEKYSCLHVSEIMRKIYEDLLNHG